MLVAGGDECILLNPGSMIKSTFWAWNPILNGGNPLGDYQGNGAHLFPFVFFWYSLAKTGLTLLSIEKLWFVLTWFFTGSGVYYLSHVLVKDHKKANIVGLMASVLYLFNIYIMQYMLMYTVRLPIMIAPWILAFMIKGLENPKENIKYAILIGIFSLLGASGWVNPPSSIILIIVPAFYWIVFVIYKRKLKDPLIFLLWTALFLVIFNIYWLYPFVMNLFNSISDIKDAGTSNFFSTSSLFDPIRFLGSWSFRKLSNKIPYIPLNHFYYDNVWLIVSSYLVIILSFTGLFFTKLIKKNKKFIFFLLLAVLGFFLVKGPQEPLKSISVFLYENMPGFWMFREPYAKFMSVVTLAVSVMFGYSILFIIETVKKKSKSILVPVSVILIGLTIVFLTAFPLPIGGTIWSYVDGPARSYHAKIPQYWNQMGQYLEENDKNGTVLVLPKNGANSTTYNWESGFTLIGSVASYFLKNPYFYYQHVPIYDGEKVSREIYDEIIEKDDKYLAEKLGFFGVKYLLTQRDIDWQYNINSDISDSRKVNSYIEDKENIDKVVTYDKLDLFEVDDDILLPKVFAGEKPYCNNYIKKNEKQTIASLDTLKMQTKDSFLVTTKENCPINTGYINNFNIGDENTSIWNEDLVLNFDIEKGDNYYLVFSRRDMENKKINYYLDNELIPDDDISIFRNNKDYYYQIALGKLDLGKHKILMEGAVKPVDIENASFERINNKDDKFGWELVDISGQEDMSKLSVDISEDAVEGNGSATLMANGTTSAIKQPLDVKKDRNYHLSFYYKNYDKHPLSYNIEFIDDEGNTIEGISELVNVSQDWEKVDVYFSAKSDKANLYFINQSNNVEQLMGIDNVGFDEIFLAPNSIVIDDDTETKIEKIEFEKINPTKYTAKINTDSPYYLNLMESFHDDWVVKKDGKIISDKNNHYLLNGYANSWLISETGEYEITIEYKRQDILTILYIISIVGIIIGIIYVAKKK